MKSSKGFIAFFSIIMGFGLMNAQSGVTQKAVAFTGEIQKKPWSKSEQSFCAQGSDYYVLTVTHIHGKEGGMLDRPKEYVVENPSTQTGVDLESFLGKSVLARGKVVQKKIAAAEDNLTQRPGGNPVNEEPFGDYICEVLRIEKLSLIGPE